MGSAWFLALARSDGLSSDVGRDLFLAGGGGEREGAENGKVSTPGWIFGPLVLLFSKSRLLVVQVPA